MIIKNEMQIMMKENTKQSTSDCWNILKYRKKIWKCEYTTKKINKRSDITKRFKICLKNNNNNNNI